MKFRTLRKLTGLCLLLLSLTSCGNTPAPSAPLRVGVMYSADIVPLVVMQERAIDQAHGFTLELQIFSSARDRDAALQAGELDGVYTDYVGVCIYQNAGLAVRITGVTDGDYRLLAGPNSGVINLADVIDRSVAISENTLIEYTLDYILDQSGVTPDSVDKQAAPRIPDRLELLRAGKIDLCLLPDPFAALAQADGATSLCSANELGLYPAVSAFTGAAIDQRSDEIRRFYTACDEAIALVNQTPLAEIEDEIIADAGYPTELEGRFTLPVYRTWQLPPEAALADAIAWSADKGLCAPTLKPSDLLCDLR